MNQAGMSNNGPSLITAATSSLENISQFPG
jgi:hypothetical protein